MSEKSSHKKDIRRSSSSSSYSSTSSASSNEKNGKYVVKSKEHPRPPNPLGNINKMRLDIGYKIQQEELSDSGDSDSSPTFLKTEPKNNDFLQFSNVKGESRERSKSYERRSYRSRSKDKMKDRSLSRESSKDRSKSRDIDLNLKSSSRATSKYDYSKLVIKDRSSSRDKKRERSKSRDRRKRVSRSRERKSTRSPSRDKKKDRSRSRERRRERSISRERLDKKEKRRERSRSRKRLRDKSRRDSSSPSYKSSGKSHTYPRRDRSRGRRSKRSRSRSRPRKRSTSHSRSFDRSKRLYDKKLNKLCILEKLGIELKIPEGQTDGEAGGSTSGISIPSYYNPAGVNPLKYAQQMQKRRLIWGSKKQETEPSVEKKEEESKAENVGPESVWKGTTFSQDQDGKLTAKFKRLMGIKEAEGEQSTSEKSSELILKQEEMFSSMEKQYEVARVSTHTHRGLGLGFGVHLPR